MPIDPVMGNAHGDLQPSERLKPLLGVPPTVPATTQHPSGGAANSGALGSAYTAVTLNCAGNEVSLRDAEACVRPDKVAAVQAALAAGTYDVAASAVASRVVDYMLVY
jgi:anti-sigma28 factor (negative regulator of flagellin synthesis)